MKNNPVRHIVKCFLPVLFISYMAIITLFAHTHVVNGVTIVHSHPFKKGSEHCHTTAEFDLIYQLNQLVVGDISIAIAFPVLITLMLCLFLVRPLSSTAILPAYGSILLRAPPLSIHQDLKFLLKKQ